MVNSLLVFLKHDGQQGDFSCFKAIVDQYESQPLCMIRPRAPSRASLSSCCHKSRDSNNGDNDKDLLPYHGSRDPLPPSPPPENCHCYENANFRPEGGNLCWGRSCFKGIKAFGDWGWMGTVVCVLSSVLSSGGDNKSSFPSLCFCVLHFFVFVCTLFVSGQYNCSCYGKPTCECV